MGSIKYDPKENTFYNADSNVESILPQVIWHITDRCFLSCPYCFATKTGRETSLNHLNDYMEAFKKLGVLKIDIAGGEPLTYKNLNVICSELYSNDIKMTITTSGVGNENVKEWLIDNAKMFSWILISIDAPTPAQHDSLRGKVGTFSSLSKLIRELKNKGYNNIRINTLITKKFLMSNIAEQFVELINEVKPLEWCLIQPHPANKKENYHLYATSESEFDKIVFNIKNLIKEKYTGFANITLRYNSNYSKYWILYPDGKLKQHTEGSEDAFCFNFNKESVSEIEKFVKEYGVWLPMKEGDIY
ncbi:radical SAM protein [Bacillus marinisedimentorum]|uniref:radical SAM protein n=1 Tax=Bacillus marinisedimentorum TaxID=1821260 RepID=UPI000871EE64|nr:radical SAM protein [Bacillus marinisedimentorum]